MRKKGRWKENMVAAMEIPRDLAYGDSIITVTGPGHAVIENYRCILRYTQEEIVVQTLKGQITITGKRLIIPCYTPCEMEISGRILGITFDR